MNSPAHDLALYLVQQGVVAAFAGNLDWSVHVSAEPASPPDVVTVYDTGGAEPDTDELDLKQPTLQVRVRAKVYETGYARQVLIRDKLIIPAPIYCATSRFVMIAMTSDILPIGRDEAGLHLLTANYRTIRTEGA